MHPDRADSTRRVRFANFELDVRSRELRSGVRRIRLQEQPFEILRLMLETPGDVVTRDELQQRLWPNGTFVDFEHALNAAVKRLRAALGDDADAPRFVETVPRRGYRFIARLDGADAPSDVVTPQKASPPRVVVLPFTNLTNDPAQEYFSDGLTEELIAQLGAIGRGRIGVIARWSSMAFKGTSQGARAIGEALRANYLLEGSVRHEEERVRITARLIEAASETLIWSDSYERTLAECCPAPSSSLSVQTDVAARVARALALELAPAAPRTEYALAPSAYQSYLKGRYHWHTRGAEALAEVLAAFTHVITEAPGFAAGHAALARTRIACAEAYLCPPRQELTCAFEAARRALDLDPDLAEAHLAMGDVLRMLNWDWPGAEQAYARALVLNPSLESAHRSYGALLLSLDRIDDAIRELERACELDPLCMVSELSAAWAHYLVGHGDQVIDRCRHTIDIDPRRVAAHQLLGAALLQTSRREEAVEALDAGLAIEPENPVTLAWLAHARGIVGDLRGAAAALERLRTSGRYVPPYHLALAHAGLGDVDSAFDALDNACAERDPMIGLIAIEPRFAPLREHPRYAALRERLRLSP
jgi:TolB-like protein/Flp pilus assembly protein TadD